MAIKLEFFLLTLRRHSTSILHESPVYSTSRLQATFMKEPNMSMSTAQDQSMTNCHRFSTGTQGSPLGPRFFAIYVNDLPNSSEIRRIHMFADDTTINYIGKEVEETVDASNHILNDFRVWCCKNHLTDCSHWKDCGYADFQPCFCWSIKTSHVRKFYTFAPESSQTSPQTPYRNS